ncbi:MAG: hypothetical protein R3A12_07565 [Ignavibacteria bacterium]
MDKYSQTQIRNLSGGQQQRIFLARALAQEKVIYIFLMNPLSESMRKRKLLYSILSKELKAEGKTIMIVHHDLVQVEDYFDKLILINQILIAFLGRLRKYLPGTSAQNIWWSR